VSRPDRLLLVTGTGTEVGKTWVGAQLAAALRASGAKVAARKPAQSFEPGEGPTDAEVLGTATGEDPADVCPPHRWYEVPMAPPMAADVLGRPPLAVGELVAELSFSSDVDVGLVEAVGGVRSPLTHDGDTVDLARALEPDLIVLVADAGLGTINAVLLSAAALESWPVLVFLNRFEEGNELHDGNRRWLVERAGAAVVTSVSDLVERVGTHH
jgi:dethiobiotin synthetase